MIDGKDPADGPRPPSPVPSASTPEPQVDDVLEAFTSDEAFERQEAAFACAQRAPDGALDPAIREELEERAREDPDAEVRQFATEALGHLDDAQDVIAVALDDPEPWVRAEAAFAMATQDDPDWEPVREGLDDEDGWVRRNTVQVLGENGELTPEEILSLAREDDHPPVRETAVEIAPHLDVPEDTIVAVLVDLLAWDGDAIARAKAAHALGDVGTDVAVDALEEHGLDDSSEEVRRSAKVAKARALGHKPPSTQPVEIRDPTGQASPGEGASPGTSGCGPCPIKPDGADGPQPPKP